jgi:hypothetical protein
VRFCGRTAPNPSPSRNSATARNVTRPSAIPAAKSFFRADRSFFETANHAVADEVYLNLDFHFGLAAANHQMASDAFIHAGFESIVWAVEGDTEWVTKETSRSN